MTDNGDTGKLDLFIQTSRSSLRDGGPEVDYCAISLFCVSELSLRQHRMIRKLVSSFRAWNKAYSETLAAIEDDENDRQIAELQLQIRDFKADKGLQLPDSRVCECLEAVANCPSPSIDRIYEFVVNESEMSGEKPPTALDIAACLKRAVDDGFLEPVRLSTNGEVCSGSTRRVSVDESGYRLADTPGRLFVSVSKSIDEKMISDGKILNKLDDLTVALGISRTWIVALTRTLIAG